MVKRVRPDTPPAVTVLIVDGDTMVLQCLRKTLRSQVFTVVGAATGPAGLARARTLRPDVILLEVTLAGMDGLEVLRRLREDRIEEPVLFLTAQTALQDKVTGLTAGAEDYITKPFNAKEVSARIRVILRRSTSTLAENPLSGRLTVADLELDLNTGHAWRHGEPIALSPTEFTLPPAHRVQQCRVAGVDLAAQVGDVGFDELDVDGAVVGRTGQVVNSKTQCEIIGPFAAKPGPGLESITRASRAETRPPSLFRASPRAELSSEL